MFCENCGKDLKNNIRYCPKCGTESTKDKKFSVNYQSRNQLVAGVIILIVLISLFFPIIKYEISSIVFDKRPHTYKSGEEFLYSGYKITASMTFENLEPNTRDCTNLYYGGMDNPNFNWDDNSWLQNLQPREGCEKENEQSIAEAKQYKNLILHLKVTNPTNKIKNFSYDWFKIVEPNGKTYSNTSTPKLEPSFEIGEILPNSSREGNSKNIKVNIQQSEFSLIVQTPGNAEQIVQLESK